MTKVKICGITNFEDAKFAVDFGADTLGFNFYQKSPRYITPESARDIIDELNGRVTTVGVFVNARLDNVLRIAVESKIDIIQLHGDEPPEYADAIVTQSGLKVIKAFRVLETSTSSAIGEYDVDAILLDGYSPQMYGGSGEVADWGVAKLIAEKYSKVYLAGGLNPENVAGAVRIVEPYAVDVASGVESTKGKKDPKKLEAFIRNAKNA